MATPHVNFINELAFRKIQGFLGTIDEHGEYFDKVYQSNRSLSASIASDYRGRFLLELIQNAYDAHPIGTQDGQIELTLDKSAGKDGTLFVANGGDPFAEKNVKGLCDIGLSQKPLGESIGNKGLGFRSVVQITDTPVIYSQCFPNLEKNQFSGFCFRFAESNDYPELINQETHLKLASRDLPPFHVPIWTKDQSETVRGYATAGFSSVVELPLRDAEALDAVEQEISHLMEQNVPILLFLDRISILRVKIIDETGRQKTEFEFTRKEESVVATHIKISRINLGDAGQFLVAHDSVPEAAIREAIRIGIAKKELNEYWESWSGDGDIAVAVRLDSSVKSPQFYAFLPLGEETVAPFFGYLHGSFVPSSNRRSLNAGIKLNATLLTASAKLAAETIHYIITDPLNTLSIRLTEKERATAAIDLLSWTNVGSLEGGKKCVAELAQRLSSDFGVRGFEQAPVVPCLVSGSDDPIITWQPPQRVRRWPEGGTVFSADVCIQFAQDGEIWPIWEALGERIDALEVFLKANTDCYVGPPSAEERAWLVSMVARTIASRGSQRSKSKWLSFFREIPDFIHQDGGHLGGLKILLGDDGQLHSAMLPDQATGSVGQPARRRRRVIEMAVFSPPDPRRTSEDGDLDVKPPKKLSKRFAFLCSALPWHGELSITRSYFEKHQLVQEFDRETILAHLSRTLRNENNREVLRGGLRWAFQLWRQPRAQGRTFRLQPQHRFRVPLVGGKYAEARQAFFSADWPAETEGQLVQEFLNASPTGLPDLDKLANNRLAAPDHPAFRKKWINDWVIFLTELGVNKGLVPESRKSNSRSFRASEISDFSFLEQYGIPSAFGGLWREYITAQGSTLLQLPSDTEYVINGELSWLPGQADIDQFSESCKVHYARLIMGWLLQNPKAQWEIDVHHRHFHQADRRKWPSPLKSFLCSARWFPIVEPTGSSSNPVGVPPCDVWVGNTESERFEPYLRRPPRELRRYLEQASDEFVRRLSIHCGLRIMDDPAILNEQLEFLAKEYERGKFDSHFGPRLLNRYDGTWRLLLRNLRHGDQEIDPNVAPRTILARRGQAIERVIMLEQDGEIEEYVYVCDTNREVDASLLEASGRLFFSLKDVDPEKVGVLFESFYGQRIRRLSQVSYELLVDGSDIKDARSRAAVDICPQLRAMLAIGMEALEGTEAQRLPADRSTVLARLDRLKMIKATKLGFTIDQLDVRTDQNTVNAFHFRLYNGQSIIVVQSSREWDWELIDVCIPAVCEAVGIRSLTPHLRLLVVHLRNRQTLQEAGSHPSEDIQNFSKILQLSNSALHSAHATLSAGMERQKPWIKAVLHLLVGSAALETFDQKSREVLMDTDSLRDMLSLLLADSDVSAEEIINVCRTALGVEDFREGLNLDFADFNVSLGALGLAPETYPDLHRDRLTNFVREKEIAITDCFRTSCAGQLRRRQPVEGYAEKRDSVHTLDPDPDWLTVYKEPPDDILIEHVNAWLAMKGAPSLGSPDGTLEPLTQVREKNRRFVYDFIKTAAPIIRAWYAKFHPENLVMPLIGTEDANEQVRKKLDDVGVIDFCTLDDIAIMEWLQALRIWPEQMPLSIDLETLVLSDDDLSEEEIRAREASEARKRENRSISLNGRPVDPHDVDLLALSEELHNGLSRNVLNKALGSISKLAEAGVRTFSPRSRDRGDHKGSRIHVPEEKKTLIGRLGEIVVYHWLRRILPKQDIDSAWRSENGTLITSRKGDDRLGYDFEVSHGNQIWQIEVKTSLVDPQSFEMGETEVRAARMAANHRNRTHYKIAYVSNLSDTNKTNVEIIPNPMTEEGARVLYLRGEGIRYGFKRNCT